MCEHIKQSTIIIVCTWNLFPSNKMSRTPLRSESDPYEDLVEMRYEIKTNHCGNLNVYVQGDLKSITQTTPVILTVHDLGSNHTEFHKLVEHPCMVKLKSRSVWLHVDLPGQECDANDLPIHFEFPSFDKIGSDLIKVLNYFAIKYCVCLGEGAGANILARFAMECPDRILGLVLIHCAVSVESVMSFFQDKIMSWKLNNIGMNGTADQYLVYHKFGIYLDSRKDLDTEKTIKMFLERLHRRMNPKNLRAYVEAYLNRTDLATALKTKLKVDTMIVSGSCPSLLQMADEFQLNLNPKLCTRVNIDNCGSVLNDAPEAFAYDLLLFCQGLGLFAALPISRSGSIVSN